VTLWSLLLVVLSECCSLAGQIFFKLAMRPAQEGARIGMGAALTAGIAVMALGFFIWLGLLSKFDLSFLYPFDGSNRVLLLIAAAVFLKEKITMRLWMGVFLITVGVALVATS
jgi:undecaprenyl phosphate-alpha-L-ara4N flippase subunit ArnE